MELLVTTLSVDDWGVVRLDTTLGNGILLTSKERSATAYLVAATALTPSAQAEQGIWLPACVQALVVAPSLYEVLAEALWEQVVQVPELEHARTRLFS